MPSSALGVAFDGRAPMSVLLDQARVADAQGAATLWISDHLFLREPFSTAAAALGVTARARVALMAVSPHIVHPVQIAMAAATLDELAPGRVVLCLGTGAPRDLADAGLEPRRPLRALRECLELTRLLLAGETVHYDGEVFRGHGHALASGRRAVPIFLAASGPQTLALADAAADGVLLSNASSVEFVRWALDQVEASVSQRRGRSRYSRARRRWPRVGRARGRRRRALPRPGRPCPPRAGGRYAPRSLSRRRR